ncbi:MAG: DUF1127 domain-containing protein [Sulfitobacter sp.]
MAFNSDTNSTGHAATALTSLSKIGHGFVSILVLFLTKTHAAVKTLQMARMLSTLSNMSDHQLAEIGIQRSDIPKYAETLMAGE